MSVCTIELTPSATGWFYPAQVFTARPRVRQRETIAPDPVREVGGPIRPICLGYGPDGRSRLAPLPPRLSVLA
jgi:hypothetical protein